MIKKFLGLFTALMIMAEVQASISVAPMRLEINANKIKGNYLTTSINVKGDMKKPMRFRVTKGYFTLNEKGLVNMVEDTDTNDPHDIQKNIRFVPSEFNVMPGKSQRVRINIVNLNQLPDGESRAILFIEDVNPKEYNYDTGRAGIGAQLIVKTRICVPVYVDKGNFTKVGDIEYLNIKKENDGLYTEIKVLSKGNSRIRYAGRIQIIDGKKLVDEYGIDGSVVGDNNFYISKDKIKTDKLTAGHEYILRAVLTYDDGKGKKVNMTKEIPLNI